MPCSDRKPRRCVDRLNPPYAVRLQYGTPERTRRVHAVIQKSEHFCQNVLKMCLSRLRSATSCFSCRFSASKCFKRLSSPTPRSHYTFFQRYKACSGIPIRRMTSATSVPVSACFSANAICSSVYLDFSISSSLPEGFSRPENSRSKWAKTGGVIGELFEGACNPSSTGPKL